MAAGLRLNWGEIFSRAVSTGVKELGDVAKAKDVSVKAEAKASAEAFAEANEKYKNEVEQNKIKLKKETDAIRGLGIQDVGKIRTVMNTYGNVDVMKSIEKDFANYQMATIEGKNDGKFKTMAEYIKGRITGAGTAMMSDEAAEQATDEAAVVGDELDIQKAEQKAKGMGITLEQYLNTQARKLSSRPAFSVEGKAARLVEESKMGLFGKTLTMEEARKMVTGGQKLGGEEAEDLPDTGYALEREGGLSTQQRLQTMALVKKAKESRPDYVKGDEILALRKSILSQGVLPKGTFIKDEAGNYTENNQTKPAMIAYLKNAINQMEKAEVKDEAGINKRQRLLAQLESEMSGGDETKGETDSTKKPVVLSDKMKNAIKIKKSKYKRSNEEIARDLVESYGGRITLEQALEMIKGL